MDEQKAHEEIMLKWEVKKKMWVLNAICICRAAGGHKLREAGSNR